MNSAPPETQEPSDRKVLYSAIGWIGGIFIFALIVAVAYLPNQSVDVYQQDADERLQLRSEVDSEQTRLVGAYEWVNEGDGVVRLPVERAMRLTVEELRQQRQSDDEAAN